jgi:D-glycero-beta-D-manno-heptose 1-phosphate adenylyltransferase
MPASHNSAEILSRTEVIELAASARRESRSIVLANGCFDVFHVGHVRYLQAAAELGDVLIVAINSDLQTRALKGEGRPVVPENERSEILAAIRGVDAVTIFEEPTVEQIIRAIRPDFHAKGTDYTETSVPEARIVEECGGRVAIVGDPKDHSSTQLIELMNSGK